MFSSAWQRGTAIDRPQGTNSVVHVQFHFPNCMFIYFRTSVCSDKIVSIGKTVSPRMNHSFGSPWFWPIAGRLTFSKDQFYIDYMFRIKNNKILKGGRFACWSLYPLSSDIFLLLTIIVIFCIVVSKSFLKIVLWHVPWLS